VAVLTVTTDGRDAEAVAAEVAERLELVT
jgi:predicted secreted protein